MVKINFEVQKKSLFLWATTFLILAGFVGVYALTVGGSGDPGHNINSIGAPSGCTSNQILQWTGTSWSCVDASEGGVDTTCATSGTCSQVCIGFNCQSTWPTIDYEFDDGNLVFAEANNEVWANSVAFEKKKEIKIYKGGTLKISFDIKSPSGFGGCAIKQNGNPISLNDIWVSDTEYINKFQIVSDWNPGDLVQLWCGRQEDNTVGVWVKNFKISVDIFEKAEVLLN